MDTHNNTHTTRREYFCAFRFLMFRNHFTVSLGPISTERVDKWKGRRCVRGETVLFVCTVDWVNTVNEASRRCGI